MVGLTSDQAITFTRAAQPAYTSMAELSPSGNPHKRTQALRGWDCREALQRTQTWQGLKANSGIQTGRLGVYSRMAEVRGAAWDLPCLLRLSPSAQAAHTLLDSLTVSARTVPPLPDKRNDKSRRNKAPHVSRPKVPHKGADSGHKLYRTCFSGEGVPAPSSPMS